MQGSSYLSISGLEERPVLWQCYGSVVVVFTLMTHCRDDHI